MVTDPKTQVKESRRYYVNTRQSSDLEDGRRAPITYCVRDWWEEEPDRPCQGYPQCLQMVDELNGRESRFGHLTPTEAKILG